MSDSSGAEDTPTGSPVGTNKSRQIYICEICGRKLSRPAHLQRHRLLHSTHDVELFQCQLCDKQFTRKDVFQRHKRGVHGSGQNGKNSGRKKSCRRCIRYKLRCTRDASCASCLNRGVECIYDSRGSVQQGEELNGQEIVGAIWESGSIEKHSTKDRDVSVNPNLVSKNPSHAPFDDASIALDVTHDGTSYPSNNSQQHATPSLQISQVENQQHESMPLTQQAAFEEADYHQAQSSWDAGNSPEMLIHSAGYENRPSERQSSTANHFGSRNLTSHAILQEPPPINLDFFDWDNFRASRMDWLGCETEWSDRQSLPSEGIPMGEARRTEEGHNPLKDLVAPTVSAMQVLDTAFHGSANDNTALNEVLDSGGKTNLTWPGILDRGGNEAWPFDYQSNKGFRKIKLPPLRQILEQTVGERPAIEKTTLMDLIKVLSAPQIPSLNDSPALEALPAVAFLSQFTKIFFAEFQAVLPIIHVPTWRIEKCPTALLAAMACIGAAYSTAEGSDEVSALLAEITQRALFWMGQSDSTAFRNTAYITASCFHQIYSLGTGNRRLYEIADASRGLLVTSLRGLGALSPESEHEDLDFQNLKQLSAASLEEVWLKWRDKEMEKRMAWSVFEYDCTLSTLTSKRGAFSVTELPVRLPCSESLWEAHSAQAWASMIPFSVSPPRGLLFYPLLRSITTQRAVLGPVPAWAKRLCAQVIGRLLWDIREIEDASTSNILGLPSLRAAHEETKSTLLKSLTALHDSLSNPTCTSDLVNMNIGCLVTHYCYLSNGQESMDLVVYIFRNSGRESTPFVNSELNRAKEHLRYIFTSDPIGTRQLACHAAYITGIARECTIYTPCETMRVFMGFAFLLAFNKFFPFQQREVDDIGGNSVKLDELPWTRSHSASRRVDRWVNSGGSASLDSVGNICDVRNFEALKQIALNSLQNLRVWGISGKFYRTIKNFN